MALLSLREVSLAFGGPRLLDHVDLMIEHGFLEKDAPLPFSNPAAHVLAGLLELPTPTGDAGWITGRR